MNQAPPLPISIDLTFKVTISASYFDYGVPYGDRDALIAAVARDMRAAASEDLLDDFHGLEVQLLTAVASEEVEG